MTPQLYDGTVLLSTVPGQHARTSTRATATASSGRSTPPPASRSGSSTPSPTAPSSSATRRSTAAAASGTRRRSTARGASSSPSPIPAPLYGTHEVPERLEPPRPQPLHRLARRPRRPDRQAALVPAGGPPRRARLRPDDPRDRHHRADRRRPDRGRAGRRQDGQGLRLPRRRRTAAVDDVRRQAPERHRAAAAQGRRRSSPATSAGSRRRWRSPPAVSSCRGSTSRSTRSATGLAGGLRERSNFKTGRGGFTAIDAATGNGALAAQAAVDGLRRGHGRERRRLHQHYAGTIYAFDTQTGKTLWTTKAPAGINSFPAIDGDTLLVGAARAGFTKKPAVPAHRLLAQSSAPTPGGTT